MSAREKPAPVTRVAHVGGRLQKLWSIEDGCMVIEVPPKRRIEVTTKGGDMNEKKRELVIREIATGKVERRIDITGMSERTIERIESGALINMDRERFTIGEEAPES